MSDRIFALKCVPFLVAFFILMSTLPAFSVAVGERLEETYGVTNPVLRTMAAVHNDYTETWAIALPGSVADPHTYWVSITCGDVGYQVGPNRVVVEGLEVINERTVANAFAVDLNREVTITDGELSIEVGGGAYGGGDPYPYTMINSIVISDTNPAGDPFTPVDISFGKEGQPYGAGAGYLPDYGYTYPYDYGNGPLRGWDVDLTGRTGYRGVGGVSEEQNSIIVADPSYTRTWNIDIPNGMYYVGLSAGDASNPFYHRVLVEDNLLVGNESLNVQQFYELENEIIYVFDGNLTVKIVGTYYAGIPQYTCLNYVTITDIRPASWTFPLKLTYQPGYSTFLPGWKTEAGSQYGSDRGFGFTAGVRQTKECGAIDPLEDTNDNQLFNTFCASNDGAAVVWKIDGLGASTDYYVYACCGDPRYGQAAHRVDVEGTRIINDVTLAADEYYLANGVSVNTGDTGVNTELDVSIGGAADYTILNYIVIDENTNPFVPWPTAPSVDVAINFQPADAPTEPGYDVDDGSIFSPIRKHGWCPRARRAMLG